MKQMKQKKTMVQGGGGYEVGIFRVTDEVDKTPLKSIISLELLLSQRVKELWQLKNLR